MTKDEALKLALEALENLDGIDTETECVTIDVGEEITAIKEALAQQQEPVAWMWRCKPYCDWPEWSVSLKRPADSGRDGHNRTEGYEDVPLYTSSPSKPWVGLTDEEIAVIAAACGGLASDFVVDFARSIEQAHGITGETK